VDKDISSCGEEYKIIHTAPVLPLFYFQTSYKKPTVNMILITKINIQNEKAIFEVPHYHTQMYMYGFVMDEVALGWGFFKYFCLPRQFSTHQLLQIH
jgi:hypothetical protein